MSQSNLILGTSSFTANGWQGTFCPRGLKAADYLSYYVEHFFTVAIDATFYACPAERTVASYAICCATIVWRWCCRTGRG